MQMPSIKQAAFHEAGHVVSFIVLGIPFQAVYLNKVGQATIQLRGREIPVKLPDMSGISLLSHDNENFEEDMSRGKLDLRYAICLMAGPVSEAIFTGNWDKVYNGPKLNEEQERHGGQYLIVDSDRGNILSCLRAAISPCIMEEDILRGLRRQTTELIEKNWTAVEIVAGKLIERNRLSYLEVKELLNGMAGKKESII